jgi:hypothetical protein
MDWSNFPFVEQMNAWFTTPKIQLAEGTVWVGDEPFTLLRLMEEVEPSEDLDPDIDIWTDRREAAADLWAQHRWTTLLDFEWLAMAGSTAQLCLVDVGLPRSFVAFVRESSEANDDTRLIVAAIEPRDNGQVLAACVRDLLSDKGSSYGTGGMWGGWPTLTTNHWPDLIPREAVWEAYRVQREQDSEFAGLSNEERAHILESQFSQAYEEA